MDAMITIDDNQLLTNYRLIKQALNTANNQAVQMNPTHRPAKLIAVSKTKPVAMIQTLFHQGQQDFGENYLQEALGKISQLSQLPIIWHYIGSIQRNKTRDIAKHFDWVHTLEREIIAQRLNEQRAGMQTLNVLIQINIDDESSKSGCKPTELPTLIEQIINYKNLNLRGVMVIPSQQTVDAFARTKVLFDAMARRFDLPNWDTISMGMSGDMTQAVAHGSTMVRVGTAIFGERDHR